MKLYLLLGSPYHDNDEVVGLYWSLEAARAARPALSSAPWKPREPDWGSDDLPHRKFVEYRDVNAFDQERGERHAEHYMIFELEALSPPSDPITAFALAALEGDPAATDAIRDVLKA